MCYLYSMFIWVSTTILLCTAQPKISVAWWQNTCLACQRSQSPALAPPVKGSQLDRDVIAFSQRPLGNCLSRQYWPWWTDGLVYYKAASYELKLEVVSIDNRQAGESCGCSKKCHGNLEKNILWVHFLRQSIANGISVWVVPCDLFFCQLPHSAPYLAAIALAGWWNVSIPPPPQSLPQCIDLSKRPMGPPVSNET